MYRVYKGRALKKRLNCFLPSSDLLLFFLSPFPIVTGKTEIVRGSICLNVFSVSSGQIYSIHIPENRRENNVQIEGFFFFSHLCPLLLLCIHIYVSPMVALLGSQQEGSGSNPPWLGPFGVEFACSLGACVVLSMSTLGQIVVQHFV